MKTEIEKKEKVRPYYEPEPATAVEIFFAEIAEMQRHAVYALDIAERAACVASATVRERTYVSAMTCAAESFRVEAGMAAARAAVETMK